MRRFLRITGWVLGGLAGFILLAMSTLAALVWMTLPGGGNRTAPIPGLSAPVDISIDDDGVPRIRASTELDAAAALGYLHARQRAFQMELTRRVAAGELSELVGSAALANDRFMRVLGLRTRAEADLAALPADTRDLLAAYARGVNGEFAARGRFVSLEHLAFGAPKPWTPVDSLLWGKLMGLYLSSNWRAELARAALSGKLSDAEIDSLWPAMGGAGHPQAALEPSLAAAAGRLAEILPHFPAPYTQTQSASNEWAVDGRHTASGAPLLAGDPHLAFGLPGIWYLARMEWRGHVLVGATAPGVPFLVLGHNGRIAWTFATTGADVQDLFVETSSGQSDYITPDGPRPFTVRHEVIHVRGGPDELMTVRETRHGPVISDLLAPQGPVLAAAMANLSPGDTAAAGLLALNRANSVAEAGQVAPLISSPVQNLLVADRQGIALYVTGRVPIRRAGDGSRPVHGADGRFDWIGWASGAELPHYVAPASGRLANANERVAPPDFPVFLGRDWFGDWRARRIRERLEASDRHTPADFAALQADYLSVFARDVLPHLAATTPADGASRTALDLLRGWDGTMAREKPQPLIFNEWMREFREALLARYGPVGDATPPGMELVADALSDSPPPGGTARCGGDCGKMLSDSLARAMTALKEKFGADIAAWRWGRAHPAVFAHPVLRTIPVLYRFAIERIGSPGDDTTVFRAGMAGRSLAATHGASYRGVYDLADLDRSLFMVAPGQSGNPASPLARNFLGRWRDGHTITIGPEPASVAATIRLTPAAANP